MKELSNALQQKITSVLIHQGNTALTVKLEHEGNTYWLKQRPASKMTFWHRLQKTAGFFIPFAMLKPTVSTGGPQSLTLEAARLSELIAHNIPAVPVVHVSQQFLLTKDCGVSLSCLLQHANTEERYSLLIKSMSSLSALHQQNLCHGRPSPKDIAVQNDTLYWLDMEENPLTVMSLEQAQARDVWLLLNGFAKFITHDEWIETLLTTYLRDASPKLIAQLRQFITILRPLRVSMSLLPKKLIGKEATRAIKINQTMEQYFLHHY